MQQYLWGVYGFSFYHIDDNSLLTRLNMRNKQPRNSTAPKPTKLAKHSSQHDQDSPQLNEDELNLLQQQAEFTSQYLFSSFAELTSAIETNQIQRLKYSQQPEKFYESEATVNDLVSKLSPISAYPDLVPDFIKSSLIKPLMELLDHPNELIVGETVEVLYEFLMMEIESNEIAKQHREYWKNVAKQYFLTRLLALLQRLDEDSPSEYETVYRILRIVEELLTINPKLSQIMVNCSKIIKYLSDRILPNFIVEYKKIDDNKFVASEILVELLQFSKENRLTFHSFNGMEVLLQCIIPYKDKELPKGMELQFLVNIFDLVNIMNIEEEVKEVFNEMEGVQLMIHFVKLKNYLSKSALRCLATGLSRFSIKAFMDSGGIKYVFPILLHHGLKEKEREEQMVIDENTCSIILELFKLTSGVDTERVIQKFKEKNFEKLLRLVEMRVEYSDITGEDGTLLEEEQYLKKLGEGLRIIEIIDLLLLNLVVKSSELKNNIKEMFKYFQFDPRKIASSLKQHVANMNKEDEECRFIESEIGKMFPFMLDESGKEMVEGKESR